MVINRTYAGNLNVDDSYYDVPPNDYVDARNVSNDSRIGSQDGKVNSIAGNVLVAYSGWQNGDKQVGAIPDPYRNRIIYAVYNAFGKHKILEFDATTGIISKIFTDLDDSAGESILAFTSSSFIQMNIINRMDGEGDLLYFLNGNNTPMCINIERTKDATRTPLPLPAPIFTSLRQRMCRGWSTGTMPPAESITC